MATAPRSLRYAPHVAVFSVGYVTFTYAAVPGFVISRYHTTLTGVGLFMSAALVSFVVAQLPAGRLVSRFTTTQVLFGLLVAHVVLAVALDLAPSLPTVLCLRMLWGLAGGLVLSVGATHVARLHEGRDATRQQGVYGGMLTLGGTFGFLLAPTLVRTTNGFGIQALGALLALPALAMLWPYRTASWTAVTTSSNAVEQTRTVLRNRVVLVAALCYVAIIGSYVTLSTFVTSYFRDFGVVGPLNVAVPLMATVGRWVGGDVAARLSLTDARLVRLTTAGAAGTFLALLVHDQLVALALPLVAMLAVSVPFGAVYNLAAGATPHEGAALALVVAAGNVAAVVLPALTGVLRTRTGSYGALFVLLAVLNGLAALSLLLTRGDTPALKETV